MAKPGLSNILITQTFQTWLDRTNDIVDIMKTDVVTASALGDTTTGNATLVGGFTANNIIASDLLRADSISPNAGSSSVAFTSPISVTSTTATAATVISAVGPRINYTSGPVTWRAGFEDTTNNNFMIDTGVGDRKLLLSPTGNLSVVGSVTSQVGFIGDGSNLTNLNAGNISTGTINDNRIPDLNANKITSGTFGADRIPDLNANKITAGTFGADRIPDLNANKITTGTFGADRIPDLNANKITTGTISDSRLPSNIVRDSRRLISGTGINVSGNGDLSADRTISAVQLTQAQATNPNSTVFGTVSGQRLAQAVSAGSTVTRGTQNSNTTSSSTFTTIASITFTPGNASGQLGAWAKVVVSVTNSPDQSMSALFEVRMLWRGSVITPVSQKRLTSSDSSSVTITETMVDLGTVSSVGSGSGTLALQIRGQLIGSPGGSYSIGLPVLVVSEF